MNAAITIGEYIKTYRKNHHMTMDEFAEKAGISKGYVSMLESGYNPQTKKRIAPTIDMLK